MFRFGFNFVHFVALQEQYIDHEKDNLEAAKVDVGELKNAGHDVIQAVLNQTLIPNHGKHSSNIFFISSKICLGKRCPGGYEEGGKGQRFC